MLDRSLLFLDALFVERGPIGILLLAQFLLQGLDPGLKFQDRLPSLFLAPFRGLFRLKDLRLKLLDLEGMALHLGFHLRKVFKQLLVLLIPLFETVGVLLFRRFQASLGLFLGLNHTFLGLFGL